MIEKPKTAKDRIILALDVDNLNEAEALVRELKDYVGYFKVGLPLIVNYGFEAFRLLEEHGAKCYYDCKFHDIPHTVQKACISLVKNNIDFLLNKGVVLMELGKFEEAVESFNKVLLKSPDNEDAFFLKEECLENL